MPNAQSDSGAVLTFQLKYHAFVKGALLQAFYTFITLGLYRFWAKTRIRRSLWAAVKIEGDALEYSGTGMELFRGFLIFGAVFLFVYTSLAALLLWLLKVEPFAIIALYFITVIVYYWLKEVASFLVLQYLSSRTLWRGIRMRLSGSVMRYAFIMLAYRFANLFCLGLLKPVVNLHRYRILARAFYFGSQQFFIAAEPRQLFALWLKAWFWTLPSLGLSSLWYKAKEMGYIINSVTFADTGFISTFRSKQYVFLVLRYYTVVVLTVILMILLTSFLLGVDWGVLEQQLSDSRGRAELLTKIFTDTDFSLWLGLFSLLYVPLHFALRYIFYIAPLIRFLTTTTKLQGMINTHKIKQISKDKVKSAEGLADVLNLGG